MATSAELYGFTGGALPEGFIFDADGAVVPEDARMPLSIITEAARDGALKGAKVA